MVCEILVTVVIPKNASHGSWGVMQWRCIPEGLFGKARKNSFRRNHPAIVQYSFFLQNERIDPHAQKINVELTRREAIQAALSNFFPERIQEGRHNRESCV